MRSELQKRVEAKDPQTVKRLLEIASELESELHVKKKIKAKIFQMGEMGRKVRQNQVNQAMQN